MEGVLFGVRSKILVLLIVCLISSRLEAMYVPAGEEKQRKITPSVCRDHKPNGAIKTKKELVSRIMPYIKEAWEESSHKPLKFPDLLFESSIRTCPYTWGIFRSLIISELVKAEKPVHLKLPSIEKQLLKWPDLSLKEDISSIRQWAKEFRENTTSPIDLILFLMKHYGAKASKWRSDSALLAAEVKELSKR